MKIQAQIIFFWGIILTVLSCSTQKNTFVSRSYHNLTAHYNAFFNGNEAYKQGIKKINANSNDNFSLIINVFPFINKEASSQAKSDMDRAKDKAAIVIKKHSIKVRPKQKSNMTPRQKAFYNRTEFCNWVPRSWLLHGKANFVNQDWYAAEENFEYIVKEYTWDPIKYEASIWLALTYVQLTKYNDARALLDRADGDKDFPKKYRKFLYQAYAQLYLSQNNYTQAISSINEALKYIKNRQEKARAHYILAQLYQYNKNYIKAYEHYTQAIKYSNTYEMTFNAQINRSMCFEGGNADYIRKELQKMLKDDKNLDYFDQIYYAIANIYAKEGNINTALSYYKKSIENSKNNNQKALSYIALADIYYKSKNYILAQAYYDSAIVSLDEKHPDYLRVKTLANNLSSIAQYLITIQTEDSLQRIAKLPEKERNKIVDEIIQKLLDEERRKQEEQQMQANNMLFTNQQSTNPFANQVSGGKWYFYNPSVLAMGMSEFRRKWGQRKLEDDWRRKNKSIVAATIANNEDILQKGDNQLQQAQYNPKQREFYLKNLPLTDSLMKLSNARLEEALFKSGEAAMNQLNDYELAIKQFSSLITRFSESQYKLYAYYDIYRIYTLLNKQEEANVYRVKIINEFPDSKFTQMLTNPNYLKEQEEKQQMAQKLYQETFESYKYDDFKTVFYNTNIADSLYIQHSIYPKFKILKALTFAKQGKIDEYKKELSFIIEKYPGTSEKQYAEELLATLNNYDASYLASLQNNKQQLQANKDQAKKPQTTLQPQQQEEEKEDNFFEFDEKANHQFLILLNKNANINQLKYNLFGYNIDYFSMFDFQIMNGIWNNSYYYIKVFPFETYKEAVKYYKHVNKNKETVFRNINNQQYYYFVISDNNLTKLQSTGELDRYLMFFKKKYLKK